MTQFGWILILPRPEGIGQIPSGEKESFFQEYSQKGFKELTPLITEHGLSLISIQAIARSANVVGPEDACLRFKSQVESMRLATMIPNADCIRPAQSV